MFRDELPQLLQKARFKANLSRPALAELSGVSADTILNIEKGRGVPRGQTVYALAEALNLDVNALLAPPAEVAQ